MTIHPLTGKPAPKNFLVDVDKLRKEYYARKPDITNHGQRVSLGTSGHRGSSLRGAFNEVHVLAITQTICDYRNTQGITGPLYIGKDMHPLSEPPFTTALEVPAANGIDAMSDGTAWMRNKGGNIMNLLAVEIMARTGRDPSELYQDLPGELGAPVYERIDAPATAEQKALLVELSPGDVKASELTGDLIQAMLMTARPLVV